jgi:dihydroneopterin aldolase
MNDYLRLNGLRFFAYHGVKPEERRDGQWFEVDVELRGNLRTPGRTDRWRTLDYQEIFQLTEQTVTGGQYHLIEALRKPSASVVGKVSGGIGAGVVRKPVYHFRGSYVMLKSFYAALWRI